MFTRITKIHLFNFFSKVGLQNKNGIFNDFFSFYTDIIYLKPVYQLNFYFKNIVEEVCFQMFTCLFVWK